MIVRPTAVAALLRDGDTSKLIQLTVELPVRAISRKSVPVITSPAQLPSIVDGASGENGIPAVTIAAAARNRATDILFECA